MTRFFEQYKKICAERDISQNGAVKEIGLPSSSVTHYVGYICYQHQMAAYTGETASVVLCVVISKIKAATRV